MDIAGFRALTFCLLLLAASCASSGPDDGLDLQVLKDETILSATIPGTARPRQAEERGGERPGVTMLMDVIGDWSAVSVALARAAQTHGWTIAAINCVGTGNDVIAKKLIRDTWVLLESGAGTRGAGLIVRYDPEQAPPGPFTATGRCPDALVAEASR